LVSVVYEDLVLDPGTIDGIEIQEPLTSWLFKEGPPVKKPA
jgi:hypothetical protein